jgi:hypothetical protein
MSGLISLSAALKTLDSLLLSKVYPLDFLILVEVYTKENLYPLHSS